MYYLNLALLFELVYFLQDLTLFLYYSNSYVIDSIYACPSRRYADLDMELGEFQHKYYIILHIHMCNFNRIEIARIFVLYSINLIYI